MNLKEEYPALFPLGDYWYPQGWEKIVKSLCDKIVYYSSLLPKDTAPPYCIQLKEKFGELRFYTDKSDFIIDTLIDYATIQSRNVCQDCGSPFNVKLRGPWISYKCDKCYDIPRSTREEQHSSSGQDADILRSVPVRDIPIESERGSTSESGITD